MRTTVRRFNDIGGAAPVLGTISNLSATAGDTTIALTWTAAENATSHQPQYRTGANAYADFGAALGGAATSATITGLTNGTAYDVRVIAGDGSTTTTSNVVSRTPAAAPVLGDLNNNLPGSGWSLVTDQPFSDSDFTTNSSWQDPATGVYWSIATNRQGEVPSIVADATAPSGDGLVFRQNYAGVNDGHEPMFPSTSLGGGLEVFIAYYVKFAATWTNVQGTGIKWHITNAMQDGSSQSAGWFSIKRESVSETAEPNLQWQFNGTCVIGGDCGVYPTEGSVRPELLPSPAAAGNLTRGSWHKVQYYMRKNPGHITIWVDDVAIVDHSGFSWNDPAGEWQSFQMGATWGGGALPNPAPADNIIYYDRCMIYTR